MIFSRKNLGLLKEGNSLGPDNRNHSSTQHFWPSFSDTGLTPELCACQCAVERGSRQEEATLENTWKLDAFKSIGLSVMEPTQSWWNSWPVWLRDSYPSSMKKTHLTSEGPAGWKKADVPYSLLQLWIKGRPRHRAGLVHFHCSPWRDEGALPIGIQT